MIVSGRRNTDTLTASRLPTEARIGTLLATTDRRLLTSQNINVCIDGYMQRASQQKEIFPLSRERCEISFQENIKHNLIILIVKGDTPVGFLIARRGASEVSNSTFMQQTFFNSVLEGVAAVKAVWVAHRVFIQFAKNNGYEYVVSVCSPYDLDFSFNKILTKDGWLSYGHTSVYRLKD